MTQHIWREMLTLLTRGESFVTATIFTQSGSAPRTAGAKMLVKPDGSTLGTIGGGKLEGQALSMAREVLDTGQSRLVKFDLTGAQTADMDMICGGTGQVLLDYYDGRDQGNLAIYQALHTALQRQQKCWLVTAFPAGEQIITRREQCLVSDDGAMVGQLTCAPEFLPKLLAGPAKTSIHARLLENLWVLVEPVIQQSIVYIFGAGHVAQQIEPVAQQVDFKTVVLDDRAEYANFQRFPLSEVLLLDSLDQPLPDLPLDENSYLVVVTRGHLHDKNVLGQLLRKPVAYWGMIGSQRKRDAIYNALEREGFTRQELAQVHCPIGLDILAETPQEIAVSIVAQLIQVRAQRAGHG